MSERAGEKEKTDWRRIGLVATVLFVPGGFLLGAVLAARRMRAVAEIDDAASPDTPAPSEHSD